MTFSLGTFLSPRHLRRPFIISTGKVTKLQHFTLGEHVLRSKYKGRPVLEPQAHEGDYPSNSASLADRARMAVWASNLHALADLPEKERDGTRSEERRLFSNSVLDA